MKIGDRVKLIGSKSTLSEIKEVYGYQPSPDDSFEVFDCDVPNGHDNMYRIKGFDGEIELDVWGDEIILDIEYYRDIKLNSIL
jgi:hypothetical protein